MAKDFKEFQEFASSEEFTKVCSTQLRTILLKYGDFPDGGIPQDKLLNAIFDASYSMTLAMLGVYHEWANKL